MTGPDDRLFYEFAGFRLDPQQRLLAGLDGQPIPMPPRVLETLLFFIERRGELLDKHTLMKAIWPQSVVEENSLNQNIAAIRRVLGERPREHRFIVTEPGRGYRFVADVRVVKDENFARSSAPAGPPTSRSAVLTRTHSSIAVLPFTNLTGDPDKEFFGDGLAEELIHTLAGVPGLRVPSRTSSFSYKGRNVDVRTIAEELEVSAVLEGSVRSAGERVRITAQLIDSETGYHLWSEHFDRRIEDLFDLQDELANAIVVQTLNVTLEGSGRDVLRRAPPTRNLEAYLLYLQAAPQLRVGWNPRLAYDMLRQALTIDPGFAQARSLLVATRALATTFAVALPGSLEDAHQEAREALAAAPDNADTHAALACINCFQGRWVAAEQCFQKALQLDLMDPWARQYYGMYLLGSVGHLRRYITTAIEADRLAPRWMSNALNVIVSSILVGRDADARARVEAAMQQGMARLLGPVPDVRATLALRAGNSTEATAVMVDALPTAVRAARGLDAVEEIYAALAEPGRRPRAVATLDQCCADVGLETLDGVMHRRLVVWYAMLGAFDRAYQIMHLALDQLARSGTIGSAWGFLWLQELTEFRGDPRFGGLAMRLKLPDYWERYGPPDGYDWRDGRLVAR